MIKAGIIGGSGYTAGELLRILANHPQAEIDFVYSTTNAGKEVASVHQDLLGEVNINFTGNANQDVDVVFLCLGHGQSPIFSLVVVLPAYCFTAPAVRPLTR